MISDEQVKSAANILYAAGKHHGWFPKSTPDSWENLDPIGKSEFLGIVQEILEAYEAAAWRPIEDAPKDGKPFHGLVDDDLIKMFWHDGFGEFVSSFRRMQLHNGHTFGNGKDYEDHSPVIHKPNYFRPIPEPPK